MVVRIVGCIFLSVLLAFTYAAPAAAQTPRSVTSRDPEGRLTVHATRLPEAVVFDGKLDEPMSDHRIGE